MASVLLALFSRLSLLCSLLIAAVCRAEAEIPFLVLIVAASCGQPHGHFLQSTSTLTGRALRGACIAEFVSLLLVENLKCLSLVKIQAVTYLPLLLMT